MKKLDRRKDLASRVLGVGKRRIIFDSSRLSEIKEAITKQDIKDLASEGIISIKEVKGRRTKKKRKTRRGTGKIRKKVKKRKQEYVKTVRKQRYHVSELRKQEKLSKTDVKELRKKIKSRSFKSKAHLKEHIEKMEAQKWKS